MLAPRTIKSLTVIEIVLALALVVIIALIVIPLKDQPDADDHLPAESALVLRLTTALYEQTLRTSTLGSGPFTVDYGKITAPGLRTTCPISSDAAGTLTYTSGGPVVYFNFADGNQVAVDVGDGTDLAAPPSLVPIGTTTT